MHLHILGICGTFMGGLALLARECGLEVSGSDANVYPPMSEQLQGAGIRLCEGYAARHLQPAPDLVVIGNALSRGNPAVEHVLDAGLPYVSGPGWLAERVLAGRHTLAVAGTHGKTTTSSMLAFVLEQAGLAPGFLIGGVPRDFGCSARHGRGRHFVVEADEYDTAFFDKRSKFLHYRPRTLVLNNLEYDHADIFADLGAIETQFHHLIRTVPGSGLVLSHSGEPALERVLGRGLWSRHARFGDSGSAPWSLHGEAPDYSRFRVSGGPGEGSVDWALCGRHNALNALAAVAAAADVGVAPALACGALGRFQGVRRRLELVAERGGVRIYDDFAHHPTAIRETLRALRARCPDQRILAVLEPRSNTMRQGVHRDTLPAALADADLVFMLDPGTLDWAPAAALAPLGARAEVLQPVERLLGRLLERLAPGDQVVIMSNGAFGGLHGRLARALEAKEAGRP